VGFAGTVEWVTGADDSDELLAACEKLLNTTRDLLLAEQRQLYCSETTFAAAFGSGYPELKGDLQHIMLACERQDLFSLKGPLLSLYHELSLILAQVYSGLEYSDFNTLAEYEQDLVALGFPTLLPYVKARDFAELHRQCLLFDQQLQKLLTDRSTKLNSLATVEELQIYLG
jgi:hypothetical protein